jgi:hypothetical protein
MHRCLLLLRTKKLVFLSFMNVDPKALTYLLLDVIDNPNAECNARFKQE